MENKILMAVVGLGFGRAHVKGIVENEEAELAAVCETNEEMGKETAQKYGIDFYNDYKKLLEDETIDAVSIAVPDFLHCEMVCAALKAGKHVLCEKPLALTLGDCRKMISEAKKTDKTFMVGQICRYTPAFVAAKELVNKGEIGDIFFMESEYAHDYSRMPENTWRRRPDRHGLLGGGCHAVDLIRWFLGNPREVFGYSNHMMLKDWPTDDCSIGIMRFPGGAIGKVFCSTGCKRDYTMRTVIYGTRGTIIVDNTSPTFKLFKEDEGDDELVCGRYKHEIATEIPVNIANHNIGNEIKDFISLIKSEKEISINALEGASTVSVCTSIIKSCQSGMPEKVDYKFL